MVDRAKRVDRAIACLALLSLMTVASGCARSFARDWPAFRGAAGDGVATVKTAPTRWSDKTNVKWKVPLPRPANGSPIVSGDCVFLTCAEDVEGKERSLYCFDREDGEKRWVRTVSFDRVMPTHKTNPYGGSTPAADGERVVVWHASAGLHCYDFEGRRQWKHDFGEFKHMWGYGTSPVIHDGKVILHSGPGANVFLVAVDLASGKILWRHDEPVSGDGEKNAAGKIMGSWATPVIVSGGEGGATEAGAVGDGGRGEPLVVCALATRVVALAPADGRLIWSCDGLVSARGDLAYSSPTIAGNRCLVKGGFEGPEFSIRLGGEGDVTASHREWYFPERPSNTGSGVVVGEHLYIPDMRGTIACVDVKTGERVWSGRGAKGQIWSSVVFAAGHLYLMNQQGATMVFEPNPEKFTLVATNELDEETNATPAIADGEVYLRTHEALYCIAQEKVGVEE